MSSLTKRSTGLVQRKNIPHGADGGGREENKDDKFNDGDEEGERDADSKETRLTLMEEVLLLGLKDREVTRKLKKRVKCLLFKYCGC